MAGTISIDGAELPRDVRADAAFFGHPRGLGWLSFTELWERFSYYGMQTLLVLYMTHQLLLPGHIEKIAGFGPFRAALEWVYGPLSTVALASAIYGLYVGLVWLAPIFGGLLADRVTGRTRAITAGAILMAAGHFLMAFDVTFLVALVCLLVGLGCFKGNLASQVGTLYAPGDIRAASAFQIYMFGIQIAVIAAPLVCGTLGELYGWHWGFGAAGVGMLIGLCAYLYGKRWVPPEPVLARHGGAARAALKRPEWRRVWVLVALLPLLALVNLSEMQVGNSYMLWGEKNIRIELFGHVMPTTWLMSIDALGSGSMIIVSVLFWRWFAARWRDPGDMAKIAIGALLMTLSPLVPALGSLHVAANGGTLGLGWALAYSALLNIGWANMAPVALGMYSRTAPAAVASTMTGLFYTHLFLATLVVGWLGGLIEKMPAPQFWLLHVAIASVAAVLLFVVRGPVTRALAPD